MGGIGGVTPTGPGLQLNPFLEAGRRSLDDELAARLAGITPGREQLLAQGRLQEARLGTNEGLDRRRMMEMLAERGALGGGVQRIDEGNLATDYLRQRQDLAQMIAEGLAGFSGEEADARGDFQRGLSELYLEAASQQANDPYSPTGAANRNPRPGTPRRRRRRPNADRNARVGRQQRNRRRRRRRTGGGS